jgi:hypothetical protein
MAHREQGDLVVEGIEGLDDDLAGAGAAAGLRVLPRPGDVILAPDQALAVPGGRHHRLDHARQAERRDRGTILVHRGREAVPRRGQLQLLGGQPADALAVHGQPRGAGGGDHCPAFLLELLQRRRVDGLDLGDDEVRLLQLDDAPDLGAVEHADDVRAMRHLHGRRVGVAVHGDHLDAQALRLDHHFLAELARAQQQQARGIGRQRRAQSDHRSPRDGP